MAVKKYAEVVTFKFPIRDLEGVALTKNIPPHVLPKFHGFENEYPDVFLF